VDYALADTMGELLANAVMAPVHPALVPSLGYGVVFVYWAASEALFGTTFGKRIMGLRVVGPAGRRVSLGAALARAAVIAVMLGGDPFELASGIAGPRIPQAFTFVSIGLALGYLAHALALAARRRSAPLLHDLLTGTRVVRDPSEAAGTEAAARPAVAREAGLFVAVGIAASVGVGLWTGSGFDWKRLVEPELRNAPFERAVEQLIVREVGIRSTVRSVREKRRLGGAPELVVGAITITLPWGAYQDHVLETAEVVTRNVNLDPRLFDRVEIVIRSGLAGALQLNVTKQWTYVADSSKTRFQPVLEEGGSHP
jgi:uncharacterized RDD family membrane protein YckC